MKTEFEIKFYVIVEDFKQKLKGYQAELLQSNCLMKRFVFNCPGKKNHWVRVRDEQGQITLTLKSFNGKSSIDSVQELELQVSSFESMCQMLDMIGLQRVRYVQNYRETWQLDDCQIMIDLWPGLDPFIEIEGPSKESVEEVAQKLDLDANQAMYGPTARLYEQKYNLSQDQFNQIKELTFDNPLSFE